MEGWEINDKPDATELGLDDHIVVQSGGTVGNSYHRVRLREIHKLGHFTYLFSNQNMIIVEHNLGYYPIINLINENGRVFIGDTVHNSLNQFTTSFDSGLQSGIIIYS